ncbi:uncharacterized protein LOC131857547 [Cryptomeria japonica]|uniref:uncharacterized protein LOC131857547 n=1 Tax=Cryptomeria japonica TaxID=3369 RepID=UPI0027D9E05D|nr:uncharacterized protein LOC131857547 [Cryptomeria japonica]
MDWSEAIIPLGKQKIKLEPEPKNKYTIFPSDNPKAQILFQECEFGNHLILAPDEKGLKEIVDDHGGLWHMEFDGSCPNSGFRAGASLTDNYTLPNMDHIMQTVSGSEMMSMLDGFFGYNQISVAKHEQHRTAFIILLRTFVYNRMPFGLINARETFQRAMDSSFKDFHD